MKPNTKCIQCETPIYKKPSAQKKYKLTFCSQLCNGKYHSKRIEGTCGNCEKPISTIRGDKLKSKSGLSFCSQSCSTTIRNKAFSGEKNAHWRNGMGSYRDRAFRKYAKKCSNPLCEITLAGVKIPSKMLDVDHIDSDRNNNKLENLQILCVWCHAIKTRNAYGLLYL